MSSYSRSPQQSGISSTSCRREECLQILPRRPPQPSPSRSLVGLENAVPPKSSCEQLLFRSWDSTPNESLTDLNKPLPQSPTRSRTSSAYSGSSGYTHIIESYGSDEEVAPLPTILQPQAYRDTIAALLRHPSDVSWNLGESTAQKRILQTSQSIPTLQYAPFRDTNWNASAVELSQVSSLNDFRSRIHNPISPVSTFSWQDRPASNLFSPSLVSPPLVHPDYHLSCEYERHFLPGPMSASVTEIVDPNLVPTPLRLSKINSISSEVHHGNQSISSPSHIQQVALIDIKEAQLRAVVERQRDLEARASELVARRNNARRSSLTDLAEAQRRRAYDKLQGASVPYERQTFLRPNSDSSDSFVLYTGIRESVKAMIKYKIQQKKESREIEKAAKVQERERKRVRSLGSEKFQNVKSNSPLASLEQREHSWTASRTPGRRSVVDDVSTLFRNLSISKAQRVEEEARGRQIERGRRPKQLAVLPSAYQKYGAEIWFAKNKKNKNNLFGKQGSGITKAATKRAVRTKRFISRHDLGSPGKNASRARPPLKKKTSEDVKVAYQAGASQLRNALGIAVEEQRKEKKRWKLRRTASEVRREKLKRSIAFIGPASQPVATGVDELWM